MSSLARLLPDSNALRILIASGFVLTAIVVVYEAFFAIHYPSNLPLAGEASRIFPKGWFSLRTRWKYFTDCAALYHETYEKYTKEGKTVLVPGFGVRHEIILPQRAMRWALSQPKSSLNHIKALVEIDQPTYALGSDRPVSDPWQGELVRTEINATLENLCEAMNDELGVAFDEHFGTDTRQWKEIDLLETFRMVVAQASSRFTVGLPLCRNQAYLRKNFDVIDTLIVNAGLTGGSPGFLKPLVTRLVNWKTPRHIEEIKKIFTPIYNERMRDLEQHQKGTDRPEPADHLQMMLRFAQKHRPQELNLHDMTIRLISANFGSMHQTSIQATNLLLDIMGSAPEYNTISVLRDEVSRIVGSGDSKWTKSQVAQMHRTDSAARETLRLHSFGNRAVFRKVMVDGLVTEDGITLPRGAIVSFLARGAQVDAETHEDPLKYDPFRFSRVREAAADADGKPGLSHLSFVSTSPQHLPFGHGKHACPGRFLIDFELKMIVAYVLTHYVVSFPPEYNSIRPPNVWVTEANIPPPGVKIRIKRRVVGDENKV